MKSNKPGLLRYRATDRRWMTVLVTLALTLSFSQAPTMAMSKSGSHRVPHEDSMSMHHDGPLTGMDEPCCNDCDGDKNRPQQPCDTSLSCMAACGKVPVQLRDIAYLPQSEQAGLPVMPPDDTGSGIIPPPFKRPPKSV